MRSARGDRHPPEPLEKHRGRATHVGLSEAGAEPRGFLLPHHMPELDPGTQRWTCCLPVHPQGLFATQASPSLIWALTPLSLWPLSFWFFSSSPSCTCHSTAPASPLLTTLPWLPSIPGRSPKDRSLISKPLRSLLPTGLCSFIPHCSLKPDFSPVPKGPPL